MLRIFAYSSCYLGVAGVDPAVIETRADELIGSVSKDEYKALAGHLGGARRNRVFHALGLSAPPRSAELKLAEGHGGPEKAKALEKAKRKKASSSAEPRKRSRLLDTILQQSPLRSKGESEDGGSADNNRPPPEATPLDIPQVAVPLRAVRPALDLEFSTAQESEDEGHVEEVNIVADSPRRLSPTLAQPLPPAMEPKCLLEEGVKLHPRPGIPHPPPRRSRAAAKLHRARRTAVVSSSVMLITKLLLRNLVRSTPLCFLAGRL